MTTFRLLGEGPPETFRCRVYGIPEVGPEDRRRQSFCRLLCAGGIVDADRWAPWIAKLQERGWLAAQPEIVRMSRADYAAYLDTLWSRDLISDTKRAEELAAYRPARVGIWRMTERGRAEIRELEATP